MSWRVTIPCNRAEGEAVGDMEEPFGDHPSPPVIVASYGNYIATDAAAHAGRSVVADPVACDQRRAWNSQPAGTASPGAP